MRTDLDVDVFKLIFDQGDVFVRDGLLFCFGHVAVVYDIAMFEQKDVLSCSMEAQALEILGRSHRGSLALVGGSATEAMTELLCFGPIRKSPLLIIQTIILDTFN